MEHPENLVVETRVILGTFLGTNVGGNLVFVRKSAKRCYVYYFLIFENLEDVPDEDEDPLDDELVVLEPLVPVLLQQGAQSLG